MLDAKLIRAQPDVVRAALARRGHGEAVDELLALDARRRELLQTVEGASARRNAASKAIAEAKRAGGDAAEEIARQAALKADEAAAKAQLDEVEERIKALLATLPNIPDETSPDGSAEEDVRVLRVVGEPPQFGFEPRDHMAIAGPDGLGLIDTERGARTSGSRFHYLLGDLVRLELAMVQWGLDLASRHGFVPAVTPVLVREEAMFNTGFFPTDEQQVYAVTGDELYLVGTAEVSLAALHTGETFAADELPRRYVGFSSCFRREAGAAGRDTRGIFRVHQFDKLELFSFCHPERSRDEHELILAIEEEIAAALGFHYRVVDIPVGDLGASAAKKYDIEVWLPGQGRFRELTSCSNTTDYQARRLGVRFRGEGGLQPVHTLNGTAVTSSRTLLAIVEYGQREDGSVAVPEPLQRYGAPAVIGGERVPAHR
jgi:seryl-tRNA synthetase